jgi:hypothetical protein
VRSAITDAKYVAEALLNRPWAGPEIEAAGSKSQVARFPPADPLPHPIPTIHNVLTGKALPGRVFVSPKSPWRARRTCCLPEYSGL